jgi:hypothetical protein
MWGAPYLSGEFQAKLRRPSPGGYQKLGLFITRSSEILGLQLLCGCCQNLSALKYEIVCGSLEFPHCCLKRFPNHALIRLLVRRL